MLVLKGTDVHLLLLYEEIPATVPHEDLPAIKFGLLLFHRLKVAVIRLQPDNVSHLKLMGIIEEEGYVASCTVTSIYDA